ncbi:hypothetical protein AAHA92_16455 [Salvia divinorum]|uniref:Uncharacterized protein n=1 Tax=Salvia divinorum TaxID=28513 RepID=A0ABD1GVK6_SALDI
MTSRRITLRNFENHISGPMHESTRCMPFGAGFRVGSDVGRITKQKLKSWRKKEVFPSVKFRMNHLFH